MIRSSSKKMDRGKKTNPARSASAAGRLPLVSNPFGPMTSPVASRDAGSVSTQDDRSPSSSDQSCTAVPAGPGH